MTEWSIELEIQLENGSHITRAFSVYTTRDQARVKLWDVLQEGREHPWFAPFFLPNVKIFGSLDFPKTYDHLYLSLEDAVENNFLEEAEEIPLKYDDETFWEKCIDMYFRCLRTIW